jgi:N6-adenosine-specific RNA methylase IME4
MSDMISLPFKKYKIILADPPWQYQDSGCNGNCEDHYVTMSIKDLCALPIKDLADDDCVLFLWATYPMLKEALMLIEAWGFEYKSIAFQWVKKNKGGIGNFYGLGRWTRGNTEPCFIATKGKPKRVSESVFQIIEAPLREHSRKPDVVRKKIVELLGDLPRIELFARDSFDGWDVWGNESPVHVQKLLSPVLSDEVSCIGDSIEKKC